MEWLTLAVWIIVFAISLPLLRGAFGGHPSLAVAAMAAAAGLALMVVYVNAPASSTGIAWAASAVAAVGVASMSACAVGLTSERQGFGRASLLRMEENEAGLAGVQLPMFCVVFLLTLMVALGIGISV